MKIIRLIGIVIVFLGLGLRVANLPGDTVAFVTGAVLIISARLYQWFVANRQHS